MSLGAEEVVNQIVILCFSFGMNTNQLPVQKQDGDIGGEISVVS